MAARRSKQNVRRRAEKEQETFSKGKDVELSTGTVRVTPWKRKVYPNAMRILTEISEGGDEKQPVIQMLLDQQEKLDELLKLTMDWDDDEYDQRCDEQGDVYDLVGAMVQVCIMPIQKKATGVALAMSGGTSEVPTSSSPSSS